MNFGMTNAPSTFVTMMNEAFKKLISVCVVVYLDDIIVFSKSPEEHEQHLRQVFTILHENHLLAKPSKCEFFRSELLFLGHIVSAKGILPDPSKVSAVVELLLLEIDPIFVPS